MIQLRSVSKTFDGTTVVDRLDLTVPPGATTALIGPSGCGKSTILRMMLGLTWPDTGEVLFDGDALSADNVLATRRRVGYVIQDGGLFPHKNGRDNVTLAAEHLGWGRERIADRLGELVRLTSFPEDGLSRYPVELSGGQRQRIALMRALMLDPDALMLDEPLGALDPLIRHDLQTELREIFRTLGKTVLLVTHDLAEADYLGDTIVLMRNGKVAQSGTLREMIDRPADEFVTRFVSAQRPRA